MKKLVRTSILLVLLLVLLFFTFNASPVLSREDEVYLKAFIREWKLPESCDSCHRDFKNEFSFISAVQDSVIRDIRHEQIPFSNTGAVKYYFENRKGSASTGPSCWSYSLGITDSRSGMHSCIIIRTAAIRVTSISSNAGYTLMPCWKLRPVKAGWRWVRIITGWVLTVVALFRIWERSGIRSLRVHCSWQRIRFLAHLFSQHCPFIRISNSYMVFIPGTESS